MDLRSLLGYSDGSPFSGNPYIDIEGNNITMANTGIPLQLQGYSKGKKKGKSKIGNPYQQDNIIFPNDIDMVREIPLKKGGLTQAQYNKQRGLVAANNKGDFDNITANEARRILHSKKINGKKLTPEQTRLFGYLSKGHTLKYQLGGNPYQQGGMTQQDVFNFLFEEDEDIPDDAPTAPTTDDVEEETVDNTQRELEDQMEANLAMQQAMSWYNDGEDVYNFKSKNNPYNRPVASNESKVTSFNTLPIGTVETGKAFVTPASSMNPDTYLKAIYGSERGTTGVDPKNVRGSASGKYGLIEATRKEMYNKYYKSQMSYSEFNSNYNRDANFEYGVARKLAEEKLRTSKTVAEALGSWYSPVHAKSGQWDTVPRPDFGNKLTMRKYINHALKNIK